MILYIEKQAVEYKQTQKIISVFKNADIIYIDHYKNIFDKKIGNLSVEKCIIVAKLTSPAITDAPEGYGHNNKTSYFFKTSLNCVYDCDYCFLKGAFKNDMQVYFVNYDEIKQQIKDNIKHVGVNLCVHPESGQTHRSAPTEDSDYELKLKSDYKNAIWFYSSDYSDILGMDYLSGFMKEFVPFFDKLNLPPEGRKYLKGDGGINTMMEVRTKSANIQPILDLGFVPKNTEFAFSLNPQSLINKYEKGTASLDVRIDALNQLLNKGYKVGIRFLPLLPVKGYKEIYTEFVNDISTRIDFSKISSSFASGLLYTKSDYNRMLKKYPKLDILYRLKQEQDGFVREKREVRDFFYTLFRELDNECFICLDEK